ncbi:hypothetical protein Tco_0031864 [Tanacetum coccineum]
MNMVPRTVLTRSSLISLIAARPVVQPRTVVNNARHMKNVINNSYSTARMPFNKITAANNSNFNKRVNIVNDKNVNVARPKAVLSAGNPQQDLKDKGVINSGCSRHMTGNRSYLTNYEEIDGGFVAFGGNSKGGKIIGKACDYAGKDRLETDEEKKDTEDLRNEDSEILSIEEPRVNQEKDASVNSTNTINTVSLTVNTTSIEDNVVDENIVYGCADDPNMLELKEIKRFSDAEDDISGVDMNNLDTYF